MNYLKKHADYIGYLGCLLVTVGLFAPWVIVTYTNTVVNFNYLEGNGKLVLICVIISAVLVFLKNKNLLYFPLIIILTITMSDLAKGFTSTIKFDTYTQGTGVYFIFLGVAVLFLYTFFNVKEIEKPTLTLPKSKSSPKQISVKKIICKNCGIKSPATATICHVCRKPLK